MPPYLLLLPLLLTIFSCASSTNKAVEKVGHKPIVKTYTSDNFATRDDTASFNIDKGKLSGKRLTLEVIYGAIGCTCAQWSEAKYIDDVFNRTEFFLEPANPSLIDADTLFKGDNFPGILVTGRFYLKEGYPKNYRPAKGSPNPARVFRYTDLKIISLGK
jgi:hypothetical protein